MKMHKVILFALLFVAGISIAKTSTAQNIGHPAYNTATTFSNDPNFIRGFCDGWDAARQVANFGSGWLYKKDITLSTSKGTITIKMTMITQPVENIANIQSEFYDASIGVSEYADSLTDPAEQQYWRGYAEILLQASYNILILNLSGGEQGQTV